MSFARFTQTQMQLFFIFPKMTNRKQLLRRKTKLDLFVPQENA